MDRRRFLLFSAPLVLILGGVLAWRISSRPTTPRLESFAVPRLSKDEAQSRRQQQLARGRQWIDALSRAAEAPDAGLPEGKPQRGFAMGLAALVVPDAAGLPREPAAERPNMSIWNPQIEGLPLVTLTKLKDNSAAWACNVQFDPTPPPALDMRDDPEAMPPQPPPKAEDFAPPGGLTRLCSEGGITIYEIDQGPLAGAFLSDPGGGLLTLASLDYVSTQRMPMMGCLVKTGRLEETAGQ